MLDNDIFVTTQPVGWIFNIPGVMGCNGFPMTAFVASGYPSGVYYCRTASYSDKIEAVDFYKTMKMVLIK